MRRKTTEDTVLAGTNTAQISCTAVIIANPTSGSYAQHAGRLEENIAFLRAQGWKVDLMLTEAAGDARKLAREAVIGKVDVVIVAGGDGTINDVIQELAGSETALGVLPIGTMNVWARETGIPLTVAGACDVLLNGKTRQIDLGRVNDHYFLLMVGIGFDGEVIHAVEKKPIKRLGVLGFLLVGTWLGLGYESFRAYMTLNGRMVKKNALQIVVGNTQLYAGTIKYTWQAKCDDGLLDVCVVRKRSMLGRIVVVVDFILRRDQRNQWVSYAKSTAIEVRTHKPVAIQVDGEPFGYTPARFTVAPRALKVIVPQKTPEGLFSQELGNERLLLYRLASPDVKGEVHNHNGHTNHTQRDQSPDQPNCTCATAYPQYDPADRHQHNYRDNCQGQAHAHRRVAVTTAGALWRQLQSSSIGIHEWIFIASFIVIHRGLLPLAIGLIKIHLLL